MRRTDEPAGLVGARAGAGPTLIDHAASQRTALDAGADEVSQDHPAHFEDKYLPIFKTVSATRSI
jgi:hypothetical protein